MKSILLLAVAVVEACAAAVGQQDAKEPRVDHRAGVPNQDKGVEVISQAKFGTTTTTWDCCKPACGWPSIAKKAGARGYVKACSIDDQPLIEASMEGSCQGGNAYSCSDLQPKVINDKLSYGFAGHGTISAQVCCKCYQFTWTDGPANGKSMIVQAINSGGLPSADDFDLYVPGGGVGDFPDTCSKQYGAPHRGWGQQYGGIQSPQACNELPVNLRKGCDWEWSWGGGNLNMQKVSYVQVKCPKELTSISGCSN